jgi:hypothetical protein
MTQPLVPFEQIGAKRTGIHKGGVSQKWVLDDRGRRLIMDLYDGTSERIDELQRYFPGVPRYVIRKWGRSLGLARQKEPPWTDEEIQYLEKYLHRISLGDIAKQLGRTKIAVQLKAKRIGLNKCYQEGYTLRALCLGLGVTNHHRVQHWIDKGWLKGTRRQTERTESQGGDVWLFTDQAIREFVRRHPEEIDLRRVDKYWFLDVIMGGLGELAKPDK